MHLSHRIRFAQSVAAVAGVMALTVPFSARADLSNGIIDVWKVNVSTVFNTTTICDSNGDCTQPNGINVVSNQSLRWGDGNQSGLDISGSPATGNVTTNGPAVANVSLTHINQPINGTTLSSVDILSTLTLTPFSPAGGALPAATITFKVHYLETPNGADPCAGGGANGVGVNVNGCADIYVTDINSLNFPFFYDLDGAGGPLPNQQYFISFFELTAGLNPLPAVACAAVDQPAPCLGFRTPEQQSTTVQFASLITTERVSIPEPGSLALVGLSLGALGFLRRRQA